MRILFLLSFIFLFSLQLHSQNLDKLRLMCIDEVNLSTYTGELSEKELQNQIAALGFRYIDNEGIKYHKELIVYDCNTGDVKFTAVFDQNKLVKEFVLYEAKDKPAKKIFFSKNNNSSYVNLFLRYKGKEIPAYPSGKTEIYDGGKLKQTIIFNDNGSLPTVTNYNSSLKKISEGTAIISGYIQGNWEIDKIGEWRYFNNEQLSSISTYDNNGKENAEKLYSKGVLMQERKFSSNGTVENLNYYANGNLKETGQQKGNLKIGTWKYFDASGNISRRIDYSNGKENVIYLFDENKNVVKQTELVKNQSELTQTLRNAANVYKFQSFYPSGKLKSEGYEADGKKVGVFEVYDESGSLSKITEFDVEGNKVNSLDAITYQTIKEKEKHILREILVVKTTHPENLNLLKNIKNLADSLSFNFDSLLVNFDYEKDYKEKYSTLLEETDLFGNLSNELNWYDSLLKSAYNFNNEVWAYSHELFETELALEKQHALNIIDDKLSALKKNHTSIKKTLFGEKLKVMNDQDKVYEFVINEIYPEVSTEISTAQDKYEVHSIEYDFRRLLKKASAVISQPDDQFKQSFQNTKSIQDKKQLFFTAK